MHRRLLPLLALLAALAGCGTTSHHAVPLRLTTTPAVTLASPAPATPSCPQAAGGHGSPGACAPRSFGLTPRRPALGGPQVVDLSNNDPCVCGARLRAEGYRGLIAKANQGGGPAGFIDRWAIPMLASARHAGLAIGLYDFDQDYTLAEAKVLVARARAAGILPGTRGAFPLYLDVEYGRFSYAGLLAQIAYLHAHGYRVGIYTGEWYWTPHAGCRWPAHDISAWLSGYPNAPVPCGLSAPFVLHQYTDTPVDRSVWVGGNAGGFGFAGYVNAIYSGPDPYAIYPRTVYALRGGLRASEHQALSTWDRRECENPVRRAVCRQTRRELVALREREWFVAHHTRDLRRTLKHPRWAFSHLGARFQGLSHRINGHGVGA